MEDNTNLSREQIGAIKQGIKLGRTLQKDHPEIADIYGYWSQGDIIKMLDIPSKYDVSDSVAHKSVSLAINGHNGSYKIGCYVGLITDEGEREWIGREHNVISSQKVYEQGLGIYGRTVEQISEDSRKGGQKGGLNAYVQGSGFHGRTAEQMSEDGLRGYENGLAYRTTEQLSEDGRKGIIAQGKTSWTNEEKQFAYKLSQEQEYQHPNGSNNASKPNNPLIALELNIQYHDCREVRSTRAVKEQLSRHRKSLVDVLV